MILHGKLSIKKILKFPKFINLMQKENKRTKPREFATKPDRMILKLIEEVESMGQQDLL